MRRFFLWLGNLLALFTAVFCTLGAVISAYDFPVLTQNLYTLWFAACLVISALAMLWRGRGLLLSLIPAPLLLYYSFPEITAGGKNVLFSISLELSRYFSLPVLFPGTAASENELTLFFAAAGLVLALLLSLAVCVWHSAFSVFALTFPIAAFSLVIEPESPNPWLLVGLLTVYITMMTAGAAHPYDPVKRGLAFFPALALAGLFLGITYFAAQPQSYTRSDKLLNFDMEINNMFSRKDFSLEQFGIDNPQFRSDQWHYNTERVTVADAGRRIETGQTILRVTASQSGSYYLRGYSMQIFNGRSWINDTGTSLYLDNYERDAERPLQFATLYGTLFPHDAPESVSMHVDKSADASDMLYLPYYTFSGADSDNSAETYDAGFLDAGGKILDYASQIPADAFFTVDLEYNLQAYAYYTQIDPSTAEGLRELALQANIDPYAARPEIAAAVADYVSSAAAYTLSPPEIPASEDFALYFLETSKQGYCVHFATAATLMLRALDIPARFTSGFAVSIPAADSAVAVTDRQAHAWVEVFYDNIGWVPLEVTPSSGGFVPPESTPVLPGETRVPEAAPSPNPSPDPGIPEGEQNRPAEGAGGRSLLIVLYALLGAGAAAFVLYLRRRLARAYREKSFSQADTNAAVISAWRYISRLHGKGKSPPAEIEELALKARFSAHCLSEEERGAVTDYAAALSRETDRGRNPLQRFWLRYVRGLY